MSWLVTVIINILIMKLIKDVIYIFIISKLNFEFKSKDNINILDLIIKNYENYGFYD